MRHLSLSTSRREVFVDLTAQLQEMVAREGWQEGALLIFNPHTTAGLTINEGADPDVQQDMLATLARLIPKRGDYRHAEGNSDAHMKASLMGSNLTISIEEGHLVLGTWQAVYFCEFDGPRERKVMVKFLTPG